MPTAKRAIIKEVGGPEVMSIVTEELPSPAPGEVQVRHGAIGFNFIDTYQRRGAYALELPTGLGFEAAGTVEAMGDGVTDIKVGDLSPHLLKSLMSNAETLVQELTTSCSAVQRALFVAIVERITVPKMRSASA